ncbi:hypothetical protein F4692_002133 [Nocardioides cavernae]|uniref:DUF4386 family protein n=1 Tax=Nocardioides cavernae TaxID=1921566 RepID=A0A7Y9KRW7_9ACTN|nr:hypothetical protein [Nocardioides cavernae]NYE37000.1 hypothetical protein [Nocardioides cavernae]
MTTSTTPVTTTHAATDSPAADRGSAPGLLAGLGGVALAASSVLFVAGAATSPPQDDASAGAYIESLGEDPFLTGLSANLFHYSWVLAAFGAIAAIGLVRGRRGRALTVVGGLAAAFGSIQFTGLLYSDWVLPALDHQLSAGTAVSVFEEVTGAPSVAIWLLSAKVFGLLGFPLLYAGLARAGVIAWWLVPLSLLPMVAFGVVGGLLGVALAVACYAPSYVVGWRLVQRSRIAA